MRAFGDGPHNFEPWSSDVDNAPELIYLLLLTTPHQFGNILPILAGIFFGNPLFKIYDGTGSMMSILAGKANSFVADITFSAASVFSRLQRLSFLCPKNS
ncbi:hypothetical protein TNCV_2546361 [Trichonephila clavipes]|nr:hypothetical protein TNCV_2546361 [Trichonephila clavipes]